MFCLLGGTILPHQPNMVALFRHARRGVMAKKFQFRNKFWKTLFLKLRIKKVKNNKRSIADGFLSTNILINHSTLILFTMLRATRANPQHNHQSFIDARKYYVHRLLKLCSNQNNNKTNVITILSKY